MWRALEILEFQVRFSGWVGVFRLFRAVYVTEGANHGLLCPIVPKFCVHGWLAKELKNVHMDDFLEFIDDLLFVYLDERYMGPTIEDMAIFLSSSPELSKREYMAYVFKMCCLCLGHVVPELPSVSLGSPDRNSSAVVLSDLIEPLQSYLLTCNTEQNIFPSADSFSSCVEMLAEFGDKALQPSYDLWVGVDFHGRSKFHANLTKTYKDVRVASSVGMGADVTLSSESSEKLLPQRKRPVQRPRIDLNKTSKAAATKSCILKLRSSDAWTSGGCS